MDETPEFIQIVAGGQAKSLKVKEFNGQRVVIFKDIDGQHN